MDFFNKIGNFFGGIFGKKKEEQKPQPTQPSKPVQVVNRPSTVNFNNQPKAPSILQPQKPQNALTQPKQQTPTLNVQDIAKRAQTAVNNTSSLPKPEAPKPTLTPQAQGVVKNMQASINQPKPAQPVLKPQTPAQTPKPVVNNPYKPNPAPTIKPQTPAAQFQQTFKSLGQQQQKAFNDAVARRQAINQARNKAFTDSLNPFGENGVMGVKQQRNFNDAVRGVRGALDNYNKWIDRNDKQEGFQWNDIKDYGRFVAKLPSGMAGGLIDAPGKIAEAMTGKRVNQDTGKATDINGVQRAGSLLDGYISTAGLGFGGSKTLLQAPFKKGGFEGAKNTVKHITKDAGKEGVEELVQNFAGDLSDDGKVNSDWKTYRDSLGLGMLGGGVMSGAGKAISGAKGAIANPYRNEAVQGMVPKGGRSQAQNNLVNALENGTDKPVDFGRLSRRKFNDVNKLLENNGQSPLQGRNVQVHPAVVEKLANKRVGLDNMTPQDVADVAYSAVHARNSKVVPSRYDHIAALTKTKTEGSVPFATIAGYDGNVSLKSAYKKPLDKTLADARKSNLVSGNLTSQDARSVSSSLDTGANDMYLADSVSDTATSLNVPENGNGVNDSNLKFKLPEELDTELENDIATAKRLRQEILEAFEDRQNIQDWVELKHKISKSSWYNGAGSNNFRSEYFYEVPKIVEDKARQLQEIRRKYQGSFDFPFNETKTPYRMSRAADHDNGNSGGYSEDGYQYVGVPAFDEAEKAYYAKGSDVNDEMFRISDERRGLERDFAKNFEQLLLDNNEISITKDPGGIPDGTYEYTVEMTDRKKMPNSSNDYSIVFTDSKGRVQSLGEAGVVRRFSSGNWSFADPESNQQLDAIDPAKQQVFQSDLESVDYLDQDQAKRMQDQLVSFGYEQAVFKDGSVLDAGDGVKYKIQDRLDQEVNAQSELLARHMQLTGDENLVFQQYTTEMQRQALGFYNPRTDTINLNRLSESVLNHEIGHKMLKRIAESNNAHSEAILDAVIDRYGVDNLIGEYGKNYGTDNIRLLAEEKLADGYADYAKARQEGVSVEVFGREFQIPDVVLNAYERVYQAVQSLIGKKDLIAKFYSDIEGGRLALGYNQKLVAKLGDTYLKAVDNVKSLINKPFDPYKKDEMVIYEKATPEAVEKIYQATGLDVSNFSHSMDSYAVQHSVKKHSKDQIPLTKEDLTLIPEVIAEPDEVYYAGKTRQGRDAIIYEKQIGDRFIYIEEVRNKRNTLSMTTAYWQNAPQNKNASAANPQSRSFTDSSRALPRQQNGVYDSNVPDNTKDVKYSLSQSEHNTDSNLTNDSPEAFDRQSYYSQRLEAQKQARQAEKKSLWQRGKDLVANLKSEMIDDMSAIEDKIVDPEAKLEMRNRIDRTLRADGLARSFADKNGLSTLVQSFKNMREMQEFEQFAIAKHAIDLEANGIDTGRNITEDKAVVEMDGERFQKQTEALRAYSDRLLEQTVDYGLISEEVAGVLKEKYPNYIPFNRIFTDDELDSSLANNGNGSGSASISSQTVIQRIEGSDREVDSPLESLLKKTSDVVKQGERNQTAKMLASYATESGTDNPFLMRELKDGESLNDRPSISYLDNGVKRTFLTSAEVSRAAKNMNREQLGVIVNALAVPARVLRMGATGVNIPFTAANIIKDYWGAAINSKNGRGALNPKAIKSALDAAFNHNSATYNEMLEQGVLGNSYEVTRNSPEATLKDLWSKGNRRRRSAYKAKDVKGYLSTLEDFVGRSEDFGRAMQYVSNKKGFMRKGYSEAEAAKLAADQARWNSTNFLRAGSKGRSINAIVPYFNASIQGQRIMIRRFKENPKRYTAKTLLGVTLPMSAALIYAYGDEENRKIMENLPDYVKDGNVILPIPGATPTFNEQTNKWEGVMTIPVPAQYVAMHRQLRDMVSGDMDFNRLADNLMKQVTGVSTNMEENSSTYMPQAVKMAIESTTNRNLFTKQDIVPEGMRGLDVEDQFTNSTSVTARQLGEMFGVSPMKIDNAIRTGTAGAGQSLLWLADKVIQPLSGGKYNADETRGKDPITGTIGRFYAPTGISDGQYYYKSLEYAIKSNKLTGRDLEAFQTITSRKYGETGAETEGKTEGDVIANNRLLASSPNVVKAISDAAKWRAEKTGKDIDPLYKLPEDLQRQFYLIKGTANKSAEQRDLENKAGDWYKQLKSDRREFFKNLDIKGGGNTNRVKFPEISSEAQSKIDKYFTLQGPEKYEFSRNNPEVGQYFESLAKYNNDVREAQGYAPQRTYPKASEYVQNQMNNKNWNDPAVKKYLQDKNIYDITQLVSLAQMQGNDLDPKALKAIQQLGKYGLVKNPDGTYALKFADEQGSGESKVQAGAIDTSTRGRRYSSGRRKSGSSRARSGGSGGSGKTAKVVGVDSAVNSLSAYIAKSTRQGVSTTAKSTIPKFTARAKDYRSAVKLSKTNTKYRKQAVKFK